MAESFQQRVHVKIMEAETASEQVAPVVNLANARETSRRLHTRRVLTGSFDEHEGVPTSSDTNEGADTLMVVASERQTIREILQANAGRLAVVSLLAVGGYIGVGGPKNLVDNVSGIYASLQGNYGQVDPAESQLPTSDTLGTPEEREGGPDSLPVDIVSGN